MNAHAAVHLPIVPIAAAVVGAFLMVITTKQPWSEVGKALLWGGTFAALFSATGSC